jgi:tRNA threonylcarbamoyladenosine biosynthesis protein TsaB
MRTDKPEAELGLYDNTTQLAYMTWPAHRQLAETIHTKLNELLSAQAMSLKSIGGIVVFQGPGSFTGLRIGLTVANALAVGLEVPIVATQDPEWIEQGIQRLIASETDVQALPFYGADVHITPQKK